MSPVAGVSEGDMAPSELLVISWNTNGFTRTHNLIKMHYGSLTAYLRRMGAAVFCIQETKVARALLQSSREAAEHGAVLDGYHSFWSFNEAKGRLGGLNGVATWVRDDVAAVSGARATQAVLSDPLDQEGRCLLVELGGLVVFNVYAPHVDSDGQHADLVKAKKKRFLELLWQRVGSLQRSGKSVVLCGDLNLTWRSRDCVPGRCWVQVHGGRVAGQPQWQLDAADGTWMRAADAARALHIACEAPSAQMRAQLPTLSARLEVTAAFTLGGSSIGAGRSLLIVNGTRVESAAQAEQELLKQPVSRLEFGVHEAELGELSEPTHYVPEQPCVELLRTTLGPTGPLVDTFARVHPKALGRFTCWNQQLNLRYSNSGSRLDYILCDPGLAQALVETPEEGLAGATGDSPGHGARAALDAATSFGRWHDAPRRELSAGEGGLGLQKDNMRLNNTQFVPPHTGMIYTPPSYSDHVPASALFRDVGTALEGAPHLSDADTRRCTPWASQPGLSLFFGRGAKRPLEPRPA
mmetsp:Transcript_72304/g.228487  ORF Transcript_72304/g.228487 Transcript_72304/m.228487 type:complete len:523 (+) Transcript_72304:74-1642(+)